MEERQDLISRQAAIDAVDAIGHIATMPDGDKCIRRSAVKYTLSMLPSAQPEQIWILCSERLPEEGQKCLVCDKGSIGIDAYIGHGNPYNWRWYVRDYEAWMPLPKPYKEGDTK